MPAMSESPIGASAPFPEAHALPQATASTQTATGMVASTWKTPSPSRMMLVVAASVFAGEVLIMLMLPSLALNHLWQEVVIDALLITLIILPLLDRFMLRPLRTEVAERAQAEEQLARSNQELLALSQSERSQRQLAEALAEATVALNRSLDLDEVLDRTLEQAHRVVPCRALAVLLLEGEWVHVARHRDRLGLWQPEAAFPVDQFARLPEIAASGQPYLVPDRNRDTDWSAPPELDWVRSLALAPLVERDKTLGFLVTFSEQPGFFGVEMVRFLLSFAAYAAVALQRADLYHAELRARHTVETLAAASQTLTQTLELQEVLDLLLVSIRRLVPYDQGWIALLETESQLVVRAFAHGDGAGTEQGKESPAPITIELAEYPELQRVIVSQRPAVADRRRGPSEWFARATLSDAGATGAGETVSWLALPVLAGGRTLGLCSLEKRGARPFTAEQVHLTEAIAGQAAIAVQNAWLFQQLRAGRERLQALSHRLVQIQESERLYVARELHDEAGQALASLMLGLGQIERDAANAPRVVAGVQELRQVANDVQENLHRLAMDLRPASLDQLGLAAALETLVEKLRRQFLVVAQFKAVGWHAERLDTELEVSLYRLAQEALTNVVRHARATHVDLLLQHNETGILLTVEDDGIGFDPDLVPLGEHAGIAGMRERCEMLGGTLIVESRIGAGTTLVAEIPYAPALSDLRRP